ncbi:MAG: hypothetical protein CMN05_09405 [Roseibacillus sp.]|jgi:rRNA maturation endonuclease Nob1|nr:hypothetical protein [Roseibacillus sp.]MBP35273.1 hypothetical protein [Roseibacillus sp.]MCP4732089.1 hypothetical protein [Roseibacillus sp.]MDP7107021.1 hypothetical protein [Roseibacillus sp.]MDP7308607.1 hypothetical protein [Roseibacillus sp.]
MIELDLPQFFVMILALVAVGTGLGILVNELRERRVVREVRRNILRCRICGTVYRKEGQDTVQSCPECASLNPCGRDRRLG